MHVVLIPNYLFGIAGLVAGGAAGLLVAAVAKNGRLSPRDARVTAPLLLAAAVAHLVLIPFVELERQVLFGVYGLALIASVAIGLAGARIWRLGAVFFPAGSILGYAYLAVLVHQADYAGLAIKVVELVAIGSAMASFARSRNQRAAHVASG
jgi:hypothetical protein